jgi:UV DNA damage endonuclease
MSGNNHQTNYTNAPRLGLVCMTVGPEIRFRTITRSRYLTLSEEEREARLRDIYAFNLNRLFTALEYCHARDIHLYRATSALFPLNDDTIGAAVLESMSHLLAPFGKRAEELGVRVVLHPDQFVVLSSLSDSVVQQSIGILERHAHIFDLLNLPRSTWAAINLHGGKSGRADALVETIARLPEAIRSRLVLENDEHAYSAHEIIDVCHRVGIPMIFDNHHHAVKEKLSNYDDPSIAEMVAATAKTWPTNAWQMVHLSNGRDAFNDPRHSDLITDVPRAYEDVPWIEVEAKAKEEAIEHLRRTWPHANNGDRKS